MSRIDFEGSELDCSIYGDYSEVAVSFVQTMNASNTNTNTNNFIVLCFFHSRLVAYFFLSIFHSCEQVSQQTEVK